MTDATWLPISQEPESQAFQRLATMWLCVVSATHPGVGLRPGRGRYSEDQRQRRESLMVQAQRLMGAVLILGPGRPAHVALRCRWLASAAAVEVVQ